jgi:glutamate carboxypeptidase
MNLINHFKERQPEMLAAIRSLVEMESPTLDAARTTALAECLAPQFAHAGAAVQLQPGSNGVSLLARIGADSTSAKPVMLLGHLDTVWPVGALQRMPFRIENERAYGPGIFDMKSGIVLMLEALRALNELQLPVRSAVKILLTCDEESGSLSSRALVESEARGCASVFVLEPSLPGGGAKTQRKGMANYDLTTHGIEAHAGLEPEKGASAILELARQIQTLHSLNDYANGVTVNVGVVKGGSGRNVVAGVAQAEVDVRFWTMEQGARVMRQIETMQPVLAGTRLELSGGLDRPPLERTRELAALYEHTRQLAAELGFELAEGAAGGGSDGNFTAALNIPTLDGLGVAGAGAHAAHEHILIDDLPRRAALLVRLLTG